MVSFLINYVQQYTLCRPYQQNGVDLRYRRVLQDLHEMILVSFVEGIYSRFLMNNDGDLSDCRLSSYGKVS